MPADRSKVIGSPIALMQIDAMTVKVRRLTDGAVIAGLMAVSAALSLATIANRPETTSTAYLFQDEGLNLVVADTLLSGGSLYATSPISTGQSRHTSMPASPRCSATRRPRYLRLLVFISCLDAGLAYALMRRAAGIPVATAITVGGIFTWRSLLARSSAASLLGLRASRGVRCCCCWR
jgi:hypothetical protein